MKYFNYSLSTYCILLTVFIASVGCFMIIPFYTIYFHTHLGFKLSIIAYALSMQIIALRLSSLVTGIVTDYLSAKWLMIAGIAICSLSYFFLKAVDHASSLVVIAFFLGLGNSLFITSSKVSLLNQEETSEQSTLLTLRNIMLNSGAVIGPLIGGILIKLMPNFLFNLAALMYLISAIITLIFVHNIKILGNLKINLHLLYKSIFSFQILPVFLLSILFMMGYSQLQLTIPMLANSISSTLGITLIYLLNALMIIFLSLPINRSILSDKNAFEVGITAVLLMAISFLIFFFAKNILSLIMGIMVLSLSEILYFPAADIVSVNQLPTGMVGVSVGIVQVAYGFGGIIGNIFGSYLFQLFSNRGTNYLWLCLTITLIIFLVPIFKINKHSSNLLRTSP